MTLEVIREGTLLDLDALDPLLEAAHRAAGAPYLSVSPGFTRLQLAQGLHDGTSVVLVHGEPIHSFAWIENLTDGDLLIHEIYASPGHPFEPVFEKILRYAKDHGRKGIVGLTYRLSVARLLRRYGMKPLAVLMRVEVM